MTKASSTFSHGSSCRSCGFLDRMKNILILGGTGKTGRRIARRLRAADRPVRTASRTGGDIPFDLDDPATWAPALDGVTAAYLVEPSPAAGPEAGSRMARLVAEAVAAGVRRLVLLSAPAPTSDDGHPLKAAEQAVRGSGVEWTILRPTWFSQNFSEDFWLPGVRGGTLAMPTGDGRTPFIDAEDIADVAAAALTEDRHSGQSLRAHRPARDQLRRGGGPHRQGHRAHDPSRRRRPRGLRRAPGRHRRPTRRRPTAHRPTGGRPRRPERRALRRRGTGHRPATQGVRGLRRRDRRRGRLELRRGMCRHAKIHTPGCRGIEPVALNTANAKHEGLSAQCQQVRELRLAFDRQPGVESQQARMHRAQCWNVRPPAAERQRVADLVAVQSESRERLGR